VTEIASSGDAVPPSFLRLAGHPLRWRLLSELGRSDRQVRELCALVGRPQSLVSYHLGRLRHEGMVSMRRSSADRRDAYYSVDLVSCGQLLTATAGALHPGLRLMRTPASGRRRRADAVPPRLLFLCSGNSARSQMAQALVEQLAGNAIDVQSAGSHPKPLHPNAVRAMREHGIDIAGRRSKHLDEFAGQPLAYVVSLCDRVREVCPEFPDRPDLIHWSIPDPAREGDAGTETYPAFQRTAAELATRIPFLLELIERTTTTEKAN
jgi:protein-tyrosine-phosphatase/DNA-binding transcriptional ArsR family regulator